MPPGRRPSSTRSPPSGWTGCAGSGIDVVGDLDDLVSVWPDDSDHWPNPDHADPADVAEAAIEALAHVLERVAPTPVEEQPAAPLARLARRLRG